MVGSPGFEPGSREPKSPPLIPIDWEGFERWLLKSHSENTVDLILRYARGYGWILWKPEKAGVLHGLSQAKRRNVMAAMACLSKYLGCYGYWRRLVKEAGLKWGKRSGLEAFLSILNSDMDGVVEWLLEAVQSLPGNYRVVLIFQALTGLRPSEAVESCRLVRSDLDGYLNRELMALEHWKYPEMFLRRSKNAYLSFVDEDLIRMVLEAGRIPPKTAIKSALRRQGLPMRMMDLRKLYATTLREAGIPREAIDLLQGRVSQNIFMMHYYKPYLKELRDKALKAIQSLKQRLRAEAL